MGAFKIDKDSIDPIRSLTKYCIPAIKYQCLEWVPLGRILFRQRSLLRRLKSSLREGIDIRIVLRSMVMRRKSGRYYIKFFKATGSNGDHELESLHLNCMKMI